MMLMSTTSKRELYPFILPTSNKMIVSQKLKKKVFTTSTPKKPRHHKSHHSSKHTDPCILIFSETPLSSPISHYPPVLSVNTHHPARSAAPITAIDVLKGLLELDGKQKRMLTLWSFHEIATSSMNPAMSKLGGFHTNLLLLRISQNVALLKSNRASIKNFFDDRILTRNLQKTTFLLFSC